MPFACDRMDDRVVPVGRQTGDIGDLQEAAPALEHGPNRGVVALHGASSRWNFNDVEPVPMGLLPADSLGRHLVLTRTDGRSSS